MFLLISVFAILSVAAMIYLIRRRPPSLPEMKTGYFPAETELRPLFAPEKDDLEREERVAKAAEAALRAAVERRGQPADTADARAEWLASPDRKTTARLIVLATETKSADTFAETAHEILKAHREGRVSGLSGNDVAALLDSHYRLLPATERGSGAVFLIKEEIANLRGSLNNEVG